MNFKNTLRSPFIFFIYCCASTFATNADAAQNNDNAMCYTAATAITLNGNDGLQRIVLPLSILQASQSRDLDDVRVLNADKQPVAYAWVGASQPTTAAPQYIGLPQFIWPEMKTATHADDAGNLQAPLQVQVRADGAVINITRAGENDSPASASPRWLLDLNILHGQRPDELIVYWKNSGAVISQAIVEASADAQHWQQVGAATLVNVESERKRQAAIEQRRVKLAWLDNSQRYLRVGFSDGLQLDHIDARVTGVNSPIEMQSANFTAVKTEDAAWLLDLGGALDIQRMQISTAQNNSVLPLDIAQRPAYARTQPTNKWITVARTTAYRLQRDGHEVTAPAIELNAQPAREWRLSAEGNNTAGADPLAVTVSWIAPQLIFAAQGAAPFILVAGCKDSAPTAMDRRALIPNYRDRDEFNIALATVNPTASKSLTLPLSERVLHASPENKRRWILWSVLIAVTAGLGLLAKKLVREMNHTKPGDK
ncbi:MAG: hypothetical protein JWM78_3306 [Verrucomicrobiaceae bacterium]|nr:hypothetical protein [Verrucomicrobiaceae bacterium]